MKGIKSLEPIPVAPKRSAHVSKKSASIPSTSPPPPPAKSARVEASTVMTPPLMVSRSALRETYLCTVIEEGSIEAVSEDLGTEVVAQGVPAPSASEVEPEVGHPLDIPSLDLVIVSAPEVPASEVHAEDPSTEPPTPLTEPLTLIVREPAVSADSLVTPSNGKGVPPPRSCNQGRYS
ncbi:hypothetical protein AMTR_s00127p00103610 [Amborella trichopoda]|uniref:Uncharacterized protein n=1 Tax=Amborella trichopoda TaxID=13333 RepID=W1NNL8_AMBTC|nr:hypothetical protein AMTR_s00127p00103610 [Amborella trichopoda]